MNDALETVARALCVADNADPDERVPHGELDCLTKAEYAVRSGGRQFFDIYDVAIISPQWRLYRPKADAFLTSLKDQGLVIVPVEPTEGMVHDGGCSYIFPSVYMGGPPEGAKRNARQIYAAMLAAATQPSQPHDPLQQAPSCEPGGDG